MTEQNKQLLLQDLCARLPYNVCVHIRYKEGEPCYGKLTPRDIQWFIDSNIEVIKPYLRPMSSMTKEEKNKFESISNCEIDCNNGFDNSCYPYTEYGYISNESIVATIDWLNAHHFDYRGLIPKGLAIAVTKENNPYS